MSTKIQFTRLTQILGWAVASVFVLGFFLPVVGAWTGTILGVWFVGTQKPRRGFLWLVAFVFLPSLVSSWRHVPLTGLEQALRYVGWMLLAAVLSALPYLLHRLTSERLPGFVSTLPFPLAAVAVQTLAQVPNVGPASAIGVHAFFVLWFAAVAVWMWNHEVCASGIAFGAIVFACAALPVALPISAAFARICLGAVMALSVWALLRPGRRQVWAARPETVAELRSPYTGSPLQLVREGNREALVSPSGERFPIRDGIPVFLKPEDLTGLNLKYNHLYETIGGFYDDIQRVLCTLKAMDRDAYVMSYLGSLEVKPGDSVLETSVGTGLNFKYLPRDIRRSGLDLSAEMLVNCQANLRRWNMDADLFRGNAESLPFTDSSFDVVFHVGGINFFSDRGKAIREMVRVARPGSLILIADETEEHVKDAFERAPLGGLLYKGRKEAVTPPVDLLPAGMLDIRVQSIWNGRFYALTFRKPAAV